MLQLVCTYSYYTEKFMNYRVLNHPVLEIKAKKEVTIYIDGKPLCALEGEPIASAMMAQGIFTSRKTHKFGEPRGVFCGIGQCNDCVMVVDGEPNVRTCVTPVKDGMYIETQNGYGDWN